MGSDKRWFVDNGLTQGFVPCHILTAFGENTENQNRPEPNPTWPKLSPTPSHNSRPEIVPKPDVVPNIQEISHARHEKVPNNLEKVPSFIPEMEEDVLESEVPISDHVLNSPESAEGASNEEPNQVKINLIWTGPSSTLKQLLTTPINVSIFSKLIE